MNIVSTMVGLSIAGIAAQPMMEMSIAPYLAAKKAEHLTQAEAQAVAVAGTAEANQALPSYRLAALLVLQLILCIP